MSDTVRPLASELAEYRALTQGVGLAELRGRTLLEVTGADRVSFLHSFTTADVKKLPVGGGCETFVTSPQGKTLGHVLILKQDQSLLLSTTPGQAATLISHFQRYVISEDLTLRDASSEWTTLLLAGPGSAALLREVTAIDPPTDMLAWARVRIARQPVIAVRAEYAGPQSYLLLVQTSESPAVVAGCAAAGAQQVGDAAVEMARIEAGVPLFGRDITADNLPQEIGRDRTAISFSKGCYLGQETVARIDALGHVNRQLVGVRFEGNAVPAVGTKLLADGKEVGQVTSTSWSPKLAAPLAIALVRRGHAKLDTRLSSASGGAVVVVLPAL
jgi:folate-binding protein YgfZ